MDTWQFLKYDKKQIYSLNITLLALAERIHCSIQKNDVAIADNIVFLSIRHYKLVT